MRSILFLITALVLAGVAPAAPARSAEKLKVVATIPDLADIAREVGGARVEVTSICRGRENVHSMRPVPSHLVALSRADVLVQQGLGLEATWLPALILNARNEKIASGQPGFVTATEGWEPIGVPESVSRQGGDLHPFGNPHVNLDPRAGRHIAGVVLAGLSAVAPEHADEFEANHASYLARLEEAERRWATIGAQLSDCKAVSYHQEFNYLAQLYGIELVGTIEVKPGIPPTAAHLASLVERMERDGVKVILTAAWSNNKQVKSVSRRTGAEVVELPAMVGGTSKADTWIAMQDQIHNKLREACAR